MATEFAYPVPISVPFAFGTEILLLAPVDQELSTSVHALAPVVGAASRYLQLVVHIDSVAPTWVKVVDAT